ncbi:MAG: hypothetical protein AMXMBFR13_00380, partial [Phycisphaerae bacterium]
STARRAATWRPGRRTGSTGAMRPPSRSSPSAATWAR